MQSHIQSILQAALNPGALEVIDQSDLHASHANAGAGHFKIIIRSACFKGKTRIQIHRMIYNLLEPYMENGIHALAIDASPEE